MVPGEQGWSVGVAGKGNQSHGVHLSPVFPRATAYLHHCYFYMHTSFCFLLGPSALLVKKFISVFR